MFLYVFISHLNFFFGELSVQFVSHLLIILFVLLLFRFLSSFYTLDINLLLVE
jgi:hypothetical protein